MAMEHTHAHDLPVGGRTPPMTGADAARESLVRALRASFNILRVLMFVLVILYLLSGVFRVEPGQQGLVARLGQLRTCRTEKGESYVFAPGWYWALPDPFDKKYIITGQVQELPVTTFLFNHKDAATTKDLSKIIVESRDLTPGVDGAMLTGDRNLSHGRWEIQYQIENAAQFVQNVGGSPGDFLPLMQRLTETAVVREVASRTIEQVTRKALDAVRAGVQSRLQAALDELQTGVRVVQVVAYTIEPGAVRQAFLDVSNAEAERLSAQEKADEEATEILNRAAGDKYAKLMELIGNFGAAQLRGADEDELSRWRGEIDATLDAAQRDGAGQVAVRLSEADSEAAKINGSLQREFEEFSKFREQRQAQPRITELKLWADMRRVILGNRQNEIFFVPDSKEIEIHVKSDPQRRLELEEERALKRPTAGSQ